MLIAIFILLLISVVAIALIVSSGTESALAGNYRSSTGVYYAASAGLEEVRGRLLTKNPNSFQNTDLGFLPPPGTPLALCAPVYLINPLGAETVAPWDPTSTYPDAQYNQEFLGSCPSLPNPSRSALSIWNRSPLNTLPFPGPLYKWVRINAVSEQSLNLDVSPFDTHKDATAVYYDGTQLNDIGAGSQVLELTALAVLPNGSQKLVQALVGPTPLNLSFPSALTLDGSSVSFATTTSPNFFVEGNDQFSPPGSCTPGAAPPVAALGYTNSSFTNATFLRPSNASGIQVGPPTSQDRTVNYTNGGGTPNLVYVTMSPNMQTVTGLNSLVQTISQNADVPVMSGMGVLSDGNNFMPAAMSATNPMTIVVNDDLTMSGWRHHGYGLLLVTGNFTYDPDGFWHGIILLIGKGFFKAYQGSSTGGHFEGALFIARTLDGSGNPLAGGSAPGLAHFEFTNSGLNPSGGNNYGVYYSNCWIQASIPNLGYKILSFREIAQ